MANLAVTYDFTSGEVISASKFNQNFTDVENFLNTDGNIPHSRLATATPGRLLVANGSSVLTAVTLSGDATLSSAGALTIANDAINAPKIATDAVGTTEIAADAVTSSEIATDAVGTAEIAADAVTASEIAADQVGTSEIAPDAVTATEIAAGAVGTSEIATDGVGTDEIAADAVTSSEIAADAVGTSEIAADSVGMSELAAAAEDGFLKLLTQANRKVAWGGPTTIGTAVGVPSGTSTVAHGLGSTPVVVLCTIAQQSNLAVSASSLNATNFTARWHQTAESNFTGSIDIWWLAIA